MAKYEFIDSQATKPGAPAIWRMCQWLSVSRSGFYHWRCRPVSATAARRQMLTERIRHYFAASDGTYGYRRIHADLAAEGTECSAELVRQIMCQEQLVPCQPRPFRVTTVADAEAVASISDLVERDFTADRPGAKFIGDITYIHTWQGFVYLATVIDCYSKKVVGWAIDDHMRAELVETALANAAESTVIEPGAIWHSDRGAQGGLNWSSQHLDRGGVQDGNGRLEQEDQRCSGEAAPAVARGPGLASGDALPGAAGSVAGGATPVLAHDRNRRHDSGSVVSDRRVGPGRHPLVSSRWRHAPDLTGRAHRPISVVRGA